MSNLDFLPWAAEREVAQKAQSELERVRKAANAAADANAALRYFADSLSEFHGEEHHEDGCPDCAAMIDHGPAIAAARAAQGGE